MSPRNISPEEFAAREHELINIARKMTERDCLTTLTIDKLVAASPYSKGTIYKHFISKEDLIMAICNTCMLELHTLFKRALSFDGSSREKLISVMVSYIIWGKLHPSQLFVVLSAHSPSVVACSSDERNQKHHECETGMMALMNEHISQAIKAGDLLVPEHMKYEQLTFALWSASWGSMALIMSKGNSIELSQMMLERETYTNARLILDGFNWKPLSTEWDYNLTIDRILTELFQPEVEALQQNGTPFSLQ